MIIPYLIRIILVCLLTLGLTGKLVAEPLSPLINRLSENKVEVKKLPQPQNLTSSWWSYFALTNEAYSQRVAEAKENYIALLVTLAPDDAKEASYQLERFLGNLKTLKELHDAPVQQTQIEQHPYQQSYTINEWLAIADQLRKQTLTVEEKKENLAHETVQLKSKEKHLATLKLTYLDLEVNDDRRISLGLELMAEHFEIEVDTIQLRLKKSAFEQEDEQLQKLRLLNKTAREQLISDKAFLEALDKEQQKLKQKLHKAEKEMGKTHLPAVIENDPLSLSAARLHNQQVVNHAMEVAGLEVQWQIIEVKKALATVLISEEGEDITKIRENLPIWKNQILENQQNAQSWSKDTETELMQAQEQMIILVAESAERVENAPLIKTLKQRISLAQKCLVELKQIEIDHYVLQNLMKTLEQRIVIRSGKFQNFMDWSYTQFDKLKKQVWRWSSEPLFTIGETPITLTGLVRVLIILSLASFISAIFRHGMKHLSERSGKNINGHGVSGFYTVGRLAHYIILLLGIILALASIGIDVTSLALVAGALSVGIGFGLQSIVNNFVSGLILLFEGTIKIGDFVELESGLMGVVREINVRSTQIKNITDNIDVIVPNSMLVSNKVINWTLQESERRIHVPFHVAYGTDKEKVKKAVLEAAARVPYTHRPYRMEAAHCWLVAFDESGLKFELVVWIDQEAVQRPGMIHAMYLWEIETSLRQYQITIPFPQRDLHIRSVFGKTDEF